MPNITGLDKLTKELEDAGSALSALDGTITTVTFDPAGKSSVDAAIRHMEAAVDEKVRGYSSNPLVASLAKQIKSKYRAAIEEKARAAQ